MKPMVRPKNVGKVEAVLRSIIGVVLMVFAFSVEGISRWIAGLIGVIFILTAIFGFWPWKGFMLKVFSKKDEKKSWFTKCRCGMVFDPTGSVESPLVWGVPPAYLSWPTFGLTGSAKRSFYRHFHKPWVWSNSEGTRWRVEVMYANSMYEDHIERFSVVQKQRIDGRYSNLFAMALG